MNKEFEKIIDQLPDLLKKLTTSDKKLRNNLKGVCEKGIYVFYENDKPIYVGRTNRMKHRILEHGRKSSTHNSAPFAFSIAKKNAEESGIKVNMSRKELENNSNFAKIFFKAKERVSKMHVRVIEIDDQIIQTIFEVYASLELETEFNDFGTH